MSDYYSAPVDLSALPGYSHSESARHHITVFLGRTSTKDNQDPRSSIPGQAAVCARRLENGEEFAAHFWDVESGYHGLDERSLGTAEFYRQLAVPLPRDGGINDLLERAEQGLLSRVICERSDRAARDMLTVLTVEHSLQRWGIDLVYATEPPSERPGELSSSHLRMRRSAQVDAELFGRTMQEMSQRGQVQHAVSGYNHGYPPYPYIAEIDPNAPKRDDRFLRRPKRHLVPHPDPRRWETARELFRLRREEHATGGEIVRLFNSDRERHPVESRWTVNRVEGLLGNPKLSGHQVYNRKRVGGRRKPIEEWVWSPQPTHSAIVNLQKWVETQHVTAALRPPATTGLDRVREAARQRGLSLTVMRSTSDHVLYSAGALTFTVRRGTLPDTIADAIISELETS